MAANSNRLSRDLLGLFLLFIGMLLLLSLGSHNPADPSLTHVATGKAATNKAGLFGSYVSGFLADMLGLAAYFAPGAFLVAGARRIMGLEAWAWWRWFGLALLAACVAISGQAWGAAIYTISKGGLLGHALLGFFSAYLGSVGTTLFWGFVFLLAVQLVTGFSWLGFIRDCYAKFVEFSQRMAEKRKERAKAEPLPAQTPQPAAPAPEPLKPAIRITERAAPVALREEESEAGFRFTESTAVKDTDTVSAGDILPGAQGRAVPGADLGFLAPDAVDETDPPWVRDLEEDKVGELAVRNLNIPRAAPTVKPVAEKSVPRPAQLPREAADEETGSGIDIREAVSTVPAADPESPKVKRVALPPFSLLHTVASASEKTPREVLEAKGRTLMTCLSDFGIHGELVGIAPGPVVTMFEVRPAAGVRVARIENLSDDLALALKAIAVRVQAPIPGTDTVGIEIPNDIREIVCLKELFCSKAFAESDSLLSMALGKDIQGAPAMADLARMPHLLVAGATGAGKSVCLNSILLSFLYKARPDEVKLLLVDPKRVEMAVYADLPHLVHPVVTEMEMAKNALNWAVNEMSERYNKLAQLGVRNIIAYNEKIRELDKSRHPELAHHEMMPYLVIIIDELADLMMTAAKEVEGYIMRLAQLARAAGIHMILATQRPSVDVVTGLIKANFPCRISFQVTSKHDSRTILDAVGAEHLLGKGDMLYKPAGGKFKRLHGAFVSDDDVAAVTDYWRSRQKPSYSVDFSDWGNESLSGGGNGGGGGGDDIASDPMYAEAVNFVREQGKASISLIQRRFRIGFNRAARFVEQMEQDGIIGPADGSKPRIVR
ncbi:DNA translocase FtsK [Desulfovibrio sp. OttesenSCG-928-O18]|nr:DNA translocase FtsK [Desulfovibrio sp. OttesenSCG-928-O18]